MKILGSLAGRRQSLSKTGARPAAAWVDHRGRSLYATWLDGGGRAGAPSSVPRPILQGGERAFVEPVIQVLSRRVIAIAWTDESGRLPLARLASFSLGPGGKGVLLKSTGGLPGQDDVALTRTSGGDLVLASSRSDGQSTALLVQRFSRGDLRPRSRVVISGANPIDPHLAGVSAGRADAALLYRDDSGIALATLDTGRGQLIRTLRLSGQSGAKGPALASDGARRLVAAWAVRNPGSGEDVQLQTINAETGSRSSIHQPHADAAGDQRDPMVALSPRGWIRTTWRDNSPSSVQISSGLSQLGQDGQWRRGAQFRTVPGVRSQDPDVITRSDDGSAILSWTEGRGRNQRVAVAAFRDRQFGTDRRSQDPALPGDRPRNRIVATLQRDELIGTTATDTFVFPTRSHSLLQRYDTILNYKRDDVIDDHHARKNVTVDPITRSAGSIRSLTPRELNKVSQSRFGYSMFGAVAFTVKGQPGTWLAINDRRDGFQANSDPILHLADYSVSRTSPITII